MPRAQIDKWFWPGVVPRPGIRKADEKLAELVPGSDIQEQEAKPRLVLSL